MSLGQPVLVNLACLSKHYLVQLWLMSQEVPIPTDDAIFIDVCVYKLRFLFGILFSAITLCTHILPTLTIQVLHMWQQYHKGH